MLTTRHLVDFIYTHQELGALFTYARAMDALRQQAPGAVTAAELDPVQRKAALVARLHQLKAQGLCLRAIATQLNAEGGRRFRVEGPGRSAP